MFAWPASSKAMSEPHPSRPDAPTGRHARVAEVLLFTCLVLGAFLRIRGIRAQIPLDDEWHGLDFALSHDAWFLFTHFSRAGANSVAFNLVLRALLKTVGWNEVTLALPSLVAGVALLWVFPRWVRRRFGDEAAVASAALLAIAPFLIFYSRTARAYALVLLLESLALIDLGEWLRRARLRQGLGFVIFGALAIWMHASALAPLLGAVGMAAAMHSRRLARDVAKPAPGLKHILLAGMAMLALAGALWAPALIHVLPSPVHGAAHFAAGTLAGMVELCSGIARWPGQIAWALTALVGLGLAFRTAREELALWLAAVGAGAVAVLATRPNLAGVAGVFARYLLVLFPLGSLAVGLAVQSACRGVGTAWRRYAISAGFVAALVALYWAGPLPAIHRAPNSFTKHPAFQLRYAEGDPEHARPDPLDPDSSPALARSELQPFYAVLANEPGRAPIIEYPFLLGEDSNLLYFAQQTHHRPVLAGYYPSGAQEQDVFGLAVGPRPSHAGAAPSPGYITNAMMVDHVLGRPEVPAAIRFETVVDISDPAAVKRSGAEYLILHGNLLREFFHTGPERVRSHFVHEIRGPLITRYGLPVFENDLITVLRLTAPP
jgi:Dolichyl-phosphate-mannose-protein mannosyltransferase